MIEVVYISPTYRQVEDFVRGIWWELKNTGIESFLIDCEDIQLEVGNFIIFCVSLSGAKTGRYSFFAEYYIDAVTDAEYGSLGTRERAVKTLEYFKTRLSPGAKEISENELIKLLTGESA